MLLRLSQYQFDVKYISQKHVPLADCMSRLCSNNSEEDPSLDIQIVEMYDGCDPSGVDWNTIRNQTMRCNIGEISHGCAKRMARIV